MNMLGVIRTLQKRFPEAEARGVGSDNRAGFCQQHMNLAELTLFKGALKTLAVSSEKAHELDPHTAKTTVLGNNL
jgi:hypothetical protein